MGQTLKQKTLCNGTKLYLDRWHLGEDSAKFLGKLVGSEEYALRLETQYGSHSTAPIASHYLTIEEFEILFNAIKYEHHHENVARVLDNIKSKEDAIKARETPIGLKGIVLSAFSHS